MKVRMTALPFACLSGRRSTATWHLFTKLVPDFHERLSFRVAPGQAVFFEGVGSPAPLFAPLDRPDGDDIAVCGRMSDRGSSRSRGGAPTGTRRTVRRRNSVRIDLAVFIFIAKA
jgi:hypothetical protein